MPDKNIPFGEKHFENKLSRIGAEIAESEGTAAQARALSAQLESRLRRLQGEVSELYVSLGEYLSSIKP